MNKMRFYSDGGETIGVKVKLEWLKNNTQDWDLFVYPCGLIQFNYNVDYRVVGVDEI